jgi:hypothetical protein
MCTDTPPSIASLDGGTPPDYWACDAIPAACRTTPTCACIVPALKGISLCHPSNCTEDTQHHVWITCMGQ